MLSEIALQRNIYLEAETQGARGEGGWSGKHSQCTILLMLEQSPLYFIFLEKHLLLKPLGNNKPVRKMLIYLDSNFLCSLYRDKRDQQNTLIRSEQQPSTWDHDSKCMRSIVSQLPAPWVCSERVEWRAECGTQVGGRGTCQGDGQVLAEWLGDGN